MSRMQVSIFISVSLGFFLGVFFLFFFIFIVSSNAFDFIAHSLSLCLFVYLTFSYMHFIKMKNIIIRQAKEDGPMKKKPI